jgi:hypothetical protein
MNWKGCRRKRSWSNFKVLSRNLHGGTEESHENPQSGKQVSGPRFEPNMNQEC